MLISLPKLGVLISALALAACSTMNQVTTVPAEAKLMTAANVSLLFSKPVTFHNTISGGLRYEFRPGGTADYSMRWFPLKKAGQWRVDGSQLCIRISNDPWQCGDFYQISPTKYYFSLPDYSQQYNTLELLQ